MRYFLEYASRDTFLHRRLHPLTKLIGVFCITAVLAIWWDFRYQLFFLILAAILVYISKVPLFWFNFILAILIGSFYPFLITAIGQTNPEIYKVLDPGWATTSILTGRVPVIGTLGLTYGGLWWLAATEIRMFLMAAYIFVFIYTTSLSELVDTLLALKVPQPIVFVISLAYKLIPHLSRMIDRITNAQRLRGWSVRHRNPIKIIRRTMPLMKPLMRQAAILTEQITVASQSRGFGSGRVTPTRGLELSGLDYALNIFFVLFLISSLIGGIFFNIGQI